MRNSATEALSPTDRVAAEEAFRENVRNVLQGWLDSPRLSLGPGSRILELELVGTYPDTVLRIQVGGASDRADQPLWEIEVWKNEMIGPIPDHSDAVLVSVWATGG